MQKTNSLQRNVHSMKYSRLILLGPPGTGKGTQAERICAYYNIPHISTGDIFRGMVSKNDPFGIKLRDDYWGKGKLVPDGITINLLKERLAKDDCKDGFLLDGFPRTLNQAKELKRISSIDLVLNLQSEMDLIVERLSSRINCKKCNSVYGLDKQPKKEGKCDLDNEPLFQRVDDRPEVVRERFLEYEKLTKPLIGFYKKEKLLKDVDGNHKPDVVFMLIQQILNGKKA